MLLHATTRIEPISIVLTWSLSPASQPILRVESPNGSMRRNRVFGTRGSQRQDSVKGLLPAFH